MGTLRTHRSSLLTAPMLERYFEDLVETDPIRLTGVVNKAVGLVIESKGPPVSVGELCTIESDLGRTAMPVEVIGFRDEVVLSMPLGQLKGVKLGDRVIARGKTARVGVGPALLGRVINSLGQPLDSGGHIHFETEYSLHPNAINPLRRANITEPLSTGVRAIDGLLTCGLGQRIGIFGGSGVGKSTLLGMMSRFTNAEVNVIALVGERGREVRSFVENDLGEDGLAHSVVVASTSDDTPLMRIRAALAATSIAEYFKDHGKNVLLIMDSVTRFAMAQREVGLAAGEPPSSRGYTPSVFALLPRLLERAGNFSGAGSITGFYTVLVEGDDMNDPIADSIRAILDGHIVLSRDLAMKNHYPCIDVNASVSRLMTEVTSNEHQQSSSQLRELLAAYRGAEDLINIGAYVKGSNARIDEAVARNDAMTRYLRQPQTQSVGLDEARAALQHMFAS